MKRNRSLKLLAFLCAAAVLGACSQHEEGAYGESVPERGDMAGIERIARQIPRGEDVGTWITISARLNGPYPVEIESGSVREAIEREKARSACILANSGENSADEGARERLSECALRPI